MDGLTNIIAKIHEQNDAECENVLASAKKEAEEILEKAQAEAKEASLKIAEKTDSEEAVARSRAVSSAETEYKRAVLSKKSELLDMAVKNALEQIKNIPDDVYFGYIEKLIVSNALEGVGKVIMSERDLTRLPKGFEEKVCSLLSDGKKIEISKDTLDFDGGFVIEYSEVCIDCSFSSLINDKMDEIRDELSKVLFA